jgi:hypothetical protein
MQQVQDHYPQGQDQGDLLESAAQAATGIMEKGDSRGKNCRH